MKFISDVLKCDSDYKSLLNDCEKNHLPTLCTGLSNVHKAAIVAALHGHLNKKIAVITPDEATADALLSDLVSLKVNAVNFPSRDYCLCNMQGYSKEYEQKRTDTLSKLLGGGFDVLTLSLDAALQYTLPPQKLEAANFMLKSGDCIEIGALCEKLLNSGYVRSELCEGIGQFSVRGGIFDIFPVNQKDPVRLEFWGDEIDSISFFDPETQRRTEGVDYIDITPACEVLFNNDELLSSLAKLLKSKSITENQAKQIEKDINALENGISIQPDRYIPLLFNTTVFDYLDDTLIILSDSINFSERLKSISSQNEMDTENLLEEGFLNKKTAKLWLTKTEFYEKCQSAVIMDNFSRNSYELTVKNIINFNFKRSTAWGGDIGVLLEDISFVLENKGTAVILAGENRAARVLTASLQEKGINALLSEDPEIKAGAVYVTTGGLSDGFEIPSQRFILITHRYIAADKKRLKKKSKKGQEIGSLDELKKGDYVVHEAHGIGIFDGINRITNGGVTKDYIKIKYAKSDVLYVPVTQLDLVSRYIGAATEDSQIKINRLGGSEWQKTRKRVKAAVKDMAKQLTALYAKRMAVKGYAFSPDTDLQNDFERRFEYDETEDQLRCINEIKADMERDVPMDFCVVTLASAKPRLPFVPPSSA